MIYGVFDENGIAKAFYDTKVFDYHIPEDAVELSEAQHLELLSSGGTKAFIDGEVVEYSPVDNRDYREKRINEYKDIRDQLDAILKYFKQIADTGQELPNELTEIIDHWYNIKIKYPKE